eukprot:CAMPEP_0197602588 /NCGR_PEP_ID=MMETSP1326-20131121/37556_1 /TAXON_ID=1155430 /ORGANISM="Genus nov. species nov., Strain RCC2288" /LENGTH=60 /DNA_ID=CAMNT_0043169981 /DNA_START=139 /DNA_END=318 /DNA_ORIENTATION=-
MLLLLRPPPPPHLFTGGALMTEVWVHPTVTLDLPKAPGASGVARAKIGGSCGLSLASALA